MSKPVIQNRIAELKAKRNKDVGIDADYVLRRLVEIDQMDVLDILNDDGSLKQISLWPKAANVANRHGHQHHDSELRRGDGGNHPQKGEMAG